MRYSFGMALPTDIPRVAATPAALELIETLKASHGPLMFHQSGGCCDGSAPMCFPAGEFKIGQRDVYHWHFTNEWINIFCQSQS